MEKGIVRLKQVARTVLLASPRADRFPSPGQRRGARSGPDGSSSERSAKMGQRSVPGSLAWLFPTTRLRRLRQNEALRTMVRETRLSPDDFVYPLFVCPGEQVRKPIRSMPGVFNLSIDEVVKEAAETYSLGVPAVILFGLPEKKDDVATGAWAKDGIVQRASRAIKGEVPGLIVIGDVCLCEYMSHGHCGIVRTLPQSPSQSSPSQSSPSQSLGAAVAEPPAVTRNTKS